MSRLSDWRMAAEAGGEYVDIEYQRWLMASDDQRRRLKRRKLILSWHDFAKTPSDILQLAKKMADEADIVKIACKTEKNEGFVF